VLRAARDLTNVAANEFFVLAAEAAAAAASLVAADVASSVTD